MRSMFRTIAERLRAGEELVMVTVVASSGATPRGAGARMLVGRGGRICGTIGGGAVEYKSEQLAKRVLDEKRSGEHDFSLTKNDVQDLGMICGGAVNVYFSYIPAGDEHVLAVAEEAERRFAGGEDLWLLSEISAGGRLGLWSAAEGFFGLDAPEWTRQLMSRHPQRRREEGRDFYVEQINSSGKVYVFGCGHVAQELVPVLAHVGFRCVALDDRPEFANEEVVRGAEKVLLVDFEHIGESVAIGPEDYICIMTRGHALDAEAVTVTDKKPGAYYGMIGSRSKIATVRKMLLERGVSEEHLDRIYQPIGLPIKAETPNEIAVSAMAEIIAVKYGADIKRLRG